MACNLHTVLAFVAYVSYVLMTVDTARISGGRTCNLSVPIRLLTIEPILVLIAVYTRYVDRYESKLALVLVQRNTATKF